MRPAPRVLLALLNAASAAPSGIQPEPALPAQLNACLTCPVAPADGSG